LKCVIWEVRRAKKAIGDMFLKDWTGSTLCNRLVQDYLHDISEDHSLFSNVSKKLDKFGQRLEEAAGVMLPLAGADDVYIETVGLVRLLRQLEVGLGEISYVAEHRGRQQIQEEFDSCTLFFQYH
jgi:hypothetical protein